MQPNGNEPAQAYDVVIAGTGIAGVAAALAAAEAGLSVALFEKDAFCRRRHLLIARRHLGWL